MRLYSGSSQEFIDDVIHNNLTDKIRLSFSEHYGYDVGRNELQSWNNSLRFVKDLIEYNKLTDNMLILEYELPYSTCRIDCVLFGKGRDGIENVVVLELKQWSSADKCSVENNVIVFVGGAKRMVAHPSLQVRGYHFMLKDFLTVFSEDRPLDLSSCSYCHNYPKSDRVLLSSPYKKILKAFPVFTKDDFVELGEYLVRRLAKGGGLEIFNRFVDSGIGPSKKLIEFTKHMIEGQRVFNLVGEQITANNTIIDRAKKASKSAGKTVIIVEGGPGTGKSVIALNSVAELLSKGLVVFHATGSRAFTSTVRKIVGQRVSSFFKYFNSFVGYNENDIDVLICDEAHRIRKRSYNRWTKQEFRSETPQVEELIKVAKVSVFFIDNYQVVRPEEIGSTTLIREAAKKYKTEIFEFELKTQFRCSGSDGYLNWIDNTLGLRATANRKLTKNEKMEFKIFQSPRALYREIKLKNKERPNSARLVAGFCWPWSDANPDGTLKKDVKIGNFEMTWEAKDETPRLAPGIPKSSLWAYDPNGVNQIGSIYTIQGFEFDYVGVIFGPDLMYNQKAKRWESHPENSADNLVKRSKGGFTNLMKNTYRVLLSRGMKGCYVYFMDKDTEKYFRSTIEN